MQQKTIWKSDSVPALLRIKKVVFDAWFGVPPALFYMSHSRTGDLSPCPVSKTWRLLEYRFLLHQWIAPHLFHTCWGEQLNLKTLGDSNHLTLLCALPTADKTLLTKGGITTSWAALIRPWMDDCPVWLLLYQKNVDKLEQELVRKEHLRRWWGTGVCLAWRTFGGTYDKPSLVLMRRWSQAL